MKVYKDMRVIELIEAYKELEQENQRLRSEAIKIAAWVSCETQGNDDITERTQTKFYNNVVKKLKAIAQNKEDV